MVSPFVFAKPIFLVERILKASEILFDIVASWKDPSMIFVVREENSQLEVQKLENHHPQV